MAVTDRVPRLLPRLDLRAIEESVLDTSTKGLPFGTRGLRLGDIGRQGWHVFDGSLPTPLAVIKRDLLEANGRWMSHFTRLNGLMIAPHGKTTMAPQLYDRQIADGAWAITVGTGQQLGVAMRFGVKRVVLANQPVSRDTIDTCFRALAAPFDTELYCLADSIEGVALLANGARRAPPPESNPLRVLVEVGFEGGRTGARSLDGAIEVARAVAGTPGLALAGIECFEGVLPDTVGVDALLDEVVAVCRAAVETGLLPEEQSIVLSAGGSAFFDRVGERFAAVAIDRPLLKVLRSGCYLIHDARGYAAAFQRIVGETKLPLPAGGLQPALELWAHVQSRPDERRAILTLGKRDAGHDAGLPMPVSWIRPGDMARPAALSEGHVADALNDQHCHLVIPKDSPLRVGDMVGLGIGHPCTTIDKWSLLMLVDDDYRVVGGIKTFF